MEALFGFLRCLRLILWPHSQTRLNHYHFQRLIDRVTRYYRLNRTVPSHSRTLSYIHGGPRRNLTDIQMYTHIHPHLIHRRSDQRAGAHPRTVHCLLLL